jgi:hypothetical protein
MKNGKIKIIVTGEGQYPNTEGILSAEIKFEPMAIENQNSINLELPESNKVIVVGAGPVGPVAALLLSKYHVPHMLVEQLVEPDNHPQARRIFLFIREGPFFCRHLLQLLYARMGTSLGCMYRDRF